ncbi:MAG: ATP-binding protein [Acidobacteriota bacterium]
MALRIELEPLDGVRHRIQAAADKLVAVALGLSWVGGLLLLFALVISQGQPDALRQARLLTGAAVCAATALSWWGVKRLGTKVTIPLFSLFCYLAVISLSIRTGTGVASPATTVALALVLVASCLIPARLGVAYRLFAVAGILGVTLAQAQGWLTGLTAANTPPAAAYALVDIGVFCFAAVAIQQFGKLFWQAVDHLNETRQALQTQVEQQQHTQAQLQDSERRLTALLNNVPMAILIFEITDGRLHYANQHALDEHQVRDVAELEASALYSRAPYSREDLMQGIRHTCTMGPHEQQWCTLNRQGKELWWNVKLEHMHLDGQTYVTAFAENITAQIMVHQALIDEQFRLEDKVKERTNELVEQQRQLNAIIDALPVALTVKDLQGRYRLCNHVFEEMVGKRKEDILTRTDGELLDFSTSYAIGHDDAQVLDSKQSKRSEQDIPTATGELKDYLVTKVPLANEQNEVQALLMLATDITDIKTLQRELRSATTEAERLAKIKAEFLANMSHEIRTPLNGVLGLAHIGAREHADTPSAQALFHKITRSGQHLLGVINDILDFSKIDAGKLNIESNCLSPVQIAEEALGVLSERASSKGLILTLRHEGVPKWIIGDSLRIKQILMNLLSNAVKFTDCGEVTLTLSQQGGSLHFAVRDTGIGMPAQMLARMFTPFEQADTSTTRQFGGTGLGLTISRQLARLMGGDITVESVPGEGSTFTLSLPNHVSDQAPVTQAPSDHTPAHPLSGLRVLAVDDVDVNREIMASLLECEGAQTHFACHGLDAIEQVRRHGVDYFDVVLMDVQMPVMDGLVATQRIKALAPHLPVIALTAHALPAERQRCLDAGMSSHLPKPVDPGLMVNTILEQVRSRAHPQPTPPSTPLPSRAPASLSAAASGSNWPPLAGADLDMALQRCGGKGAVLLKILSKFAQSQQGFVRQFEALQMQDADQARRAAHALKGTAANLGFNELSALAAELEQACLDAAEPEQISQRLHQLGRQLDMTLTSLDDWLHRHAEGIGIAYNTR